MQFLAPSAFFGFFALAAIPTILYILFRRKKRDVPWAATYILRRTLKKQSKANVWKQYIIVLIRTLAFTALPLIFLNPHQVWRPPEGGAFPQPPPSNHRILLMDLSNSMTASYRSTTCLNASLSLCRKILQSGRSPGRVELVSLSDPGASVIFDDWPASSAFLEESLGKMRASDSAPDFDKGLRYALQQFRASPHEHKELYLFSDFSARDLEDFPAFAGPVRSLKKLGARIFCLTYENPEAKNFALLDITPDLELLLEGQPTLFYVHVGYYGASSPADTWLTLRTAKGETLWEETLSLAVGEKILEIPLAFQGGEQTLIASFREDDLTLDNTLERSYLVRESLRLGIVQNLNLSEGFENPREWLKLSLMAAGGGQPRSITELAHIRDNMRSRGQAIPEHSSQSVTEASGRYRTIVESVLPSQAGPDFFQTKDGVISLDVDTISGELEDALRSYVVRGGTLLLAPGPRAAPPQFNESFRHLLPALLAAPVLQQIDPEVYSHAVLKAPRNRILRELSSMEHGHLGNARFYNHYQLAEGYLAEHADILFSLSDGSPLLLSRSLGRGACLLWTAGLGGEWHSMVVHPVYPVFFSRLFNRAASQQQFALNLKPGEPIIREVETAEVQARFPDGRTETVRSVLAGSKRFVRFDRTSLPGDYTLTPSLPDDSAPADSYRYHVAEDRAESDYRPLAGEARAAFEQAMTSPLYPSEEALVAAVGSGYRGKILSPSFALAMIFFFLLEAGLTRKWFA